MSNYEDIIKNTNFNENDFSYELNDSFRLWLHTIQAYKPYNTKEEELAAAIHIKDDLEMRSEFINKHLFLVLAVIRDFKKTHEFYPNINDMISAGNAALIKAVDKFDPDKGFWFSSYARRCIEGCIKNLNAKTLIGIPKEKIDELSKLNKLINECAKELEKQPTRQEIIDFVDGEYTEEEIEELFQIKNNVNIESLDEEINSESETSLMDLIEDENEETPSECASNDFIANKLYEIYCRELNDLELDIWINRDKYAVIRNNSNNPKWLYTKIMVDYSSQIKTREMARTIVSRINKKLRTPTVWKEIQQLTGDWIEIDDKKEDK